MAGTPRLRDVSRLLAPAVAETVRNLPLKPEDAAAAALAGALARAVDDAADDPDVLTALAPRLLAVLDALGATPKARAAAAGKSSGPDAAVPGASALELLRGGAS